MGEKSKKKRLGFDDVMAMFTISVLIILTTIGVFMRYVLEQPIEWAEEVQSLFFIWTVFFGASSVMKAEGHVGIDIFVAYMPPKVQRVMRIIANVIVMVILVVLMVLGIMLSIGAWVKITPVLQVKYTFIDIAVPVGAVLMLIQLAKQTWREIAGEKGIKLGEGGSSR